MKYAVIQTTSETRMHPTNGPYVVESSVVTNVVLWDGQTAWQPESGIAIELPNDSQVQIGWVAVEIDGIWEFSEN